MNKHILKSFKKIFRELDSEIPKKYTRIIPNKKKNIKKFNSKNERDLNNEI